MSEYVSVPKEPTETMLKAGADMYYATLNSAADFEHHAFHVFQAMLAAAPAEQQTEKAAPLTREQINAIVRIKGGTIDKLCDMALRWLEVEEAEPQFFMNIYTGKTRVNPSVKVNFVNASTVAGVQEISLIAKPEA